MKTDRKTFILLIRGMADLLETGLTIKKALECMGISMNGTKCGKLAESVLHFVLEGFSFSSALQLNTVIRVDCQAVTVLAAAEKTGNIVPALRFLLTGNEQKEETGNLLLEVSLYPALVLCVAGGGTAFLLQQYRRFAFDEPPEGAAVSFLRAGLFLLLFITLFCYVYYRIFSSDTAGIFFYETAFLLSSGLSVTDTLRIISGVSDDRVSFLAECMIPDVRAGVSFPEVFRKFFPKLRDTESQMLLNLASSDGNLAAACNAVWLRLKKKSDSRKKTALRMAEPVLLTGTGICLLILLEGAVLPFLTQFGGAL